jgi:hypothetical protein
MWVQILSVQHHRMLMEKNIGPMTKLVHALEASDPAKLDQLRREFDALVALYFDENHVQSDYLLTRAIKV